jgi:hypothetical protein
LRFIHLFGGYSTTELVYQYARLEGITRQKARTYITDILLNRAMYHNHGVIEQPQEQFSVRNPYSHNRLNHGIFLVYKVSEYGEQVLKETGLWNEYAPKAHGWYKHQMMTACMYQIFYLAARKTDIPFTPQHRLKPRESFIAVPPKVKVFPDAMFVMHLARPFLFFLEMDRGTERGSRKSKRKTWGKSIEYYRKILEYGLYLDNLDLPEDHRTFLIAMTVDATMHSRILKRIEAVYEDTNGKCPQILVTTTRAFGPRPTDHFPPKYFNVLATLWERSGYPKPVDFTRHKKDRRRN